MFDGRGRGEHNHYYAAPARAKVEASNDVMIRTILLSQQPVVDLFDQGYNFSYVSICYTSCLCLRSKTLVAPLVVSTLMSMSESFIVDQVFRSFLVNI